MKRCIFLLAGYAALAQSPLPSFEVASVRPAPPRDRRQSRIRGGPGTENPGYIYATSFPLPALIVRAYHLKPYQFAYPSWMDEPRYDITAKVPPGTSVDQSDLMMQQLLLERFQLKAHREKREIRIYALTASRGGPKIHPVPDDAERILTAQALRREFGANFRVPDPDVLARGTFRSFGPDGARITISKQTPERFAEILSRTVDRPVFDRTGLEGIFSFRLAWMPPKGWTPGAALSPDSDTELGVSIFTAIQQQLGLKLEPDKALVEVLVVDSANKLPSEN